MRSVIYPKTIANSFAIVDSRQQPLPTDGPASLQEDRQEWWTRKKNKNCAVFNLRQRYNSSSLSLEAAIIVDIEDE